ncbi:nitroreductase family protein [Oharaeibacter diazotrophicus]|uniref:Putative NAD(P)H nitroreductase n=2 Tax=Oharaeibacter diazotrophicus TaxID=1920512 RepID=A0A4R6R9H4_9HYPH|nr:nitroreductase [Oharaeibacter diazotrophicus]TDP82574.1 nitroreductase [Oharaeibacter diazotrophicus]BBE72662.1 putative NAD(P)H nitroreductase YdjA [Pleomorphomonas sp. SM30]GLS76696.1 nitroreductase [Oharaeibacter diazotrophicus]
MPDALDLLRTRRSIPAQFLAEPGPNEAQLETLLTIASRVPDHGKLAPWRFVIFRGPARTAAGERLAALLKARDPAVSEARLAEERARLARAPLVVALISRAAEHVKIPIWEQQLSAGAAAMNLEIAAHAMGFAACWLTEWVAYDAEAAAILGVKPGERIAGLIHVGTPTIPPQDRPRPALADIVTEWTAD